jgi:hypothetical protein
MLEGKVIRVVKDLVGELDKGILGEIFVVKEHFLEDEINEESIRIDASTVNEELSSNYDIFKGEWEVLSDDEVKEILFKKFTRLGEKMLSL